MRSTSTSSSRSGTSSAAASIQLSQKTFCPARYDKTTISVSAPRRITLRAMSTASGGGSLGIGSRGSLAISGRKRTGFAGVVGRDSAWGGGRLGVERRILGQQGPHADDRGLRRCGHVVEPFELTLRDLPDALGHLGRDG